MINYKDPGTGAIEFTKRYTEGCTSDEALSVIQKLLRGNYTTRPINALNDLTTAVTTGETIVYATLGELVAKNVSEVLKRYKDANRGQIRSY